jgi:hypothetical protein
MVRYLVESGADVDNFDRFGVTAMTAAVIEPQGRPDVARCLIELGASIGIVDSEPDTNYIPKCETALITRARNGRYSTTQFLLEHTGADFGDVSKKGDTVWDELINWVLNRESFDDEVNDPVEVTALLRVTVLCGTPPPPREEQPTPVIFLSHENERVLQEGARLRARLPAYFVWRRALLDAHCPALLTPLRALGHGYMELTTTEELWAP